MIFPENSLEDLTSHTHHALITVVLKITPIPNADFIELATVDGYDCVVKKGHYKVGDLVTFIPPDTVLLPGNERTATFTTDGPLLVKARRYRKAWSQGVILDAVEGYTEGAIVSQYFSMKHYNPQSATAHRDKVSASRGNQAKQPSGTIPVYDLENFRYAQYRKDIEGHNVRVTEKLHGQNLRATWDNGDLKLGTRRTWQHSQKELVEMNRFWQWSVIWAMVKRTVKALLKFQLPKLHRPAIQAGYLYEACEKNDNRLRQLCERYPNLLFFGELYGDVQDLKYGHKSGEYSYVLFDAFDKVTGNYVNPTLLADFPQELLPYVFYVGPYDYDKIMATVDGPTMHMKGDGKPHVREGVSVQSLEDPSVTLKVVSPDYLAR